MVGFVFPSKPKLVNELDFIKKLFLKNGYPNTIKYKVKVKLSPFSRERLEGSLFNNYYPEV